MRLWTARRGIYHLPMSRKNPRTLLRLSFTPDGSRSDDIELRNTLRNTWREEIGPLIEAISDVTGKDHAITFPDMVRNQDQGRIEHQEVLTWSEQDRRNRVPAPWWRLWPRLNLAQE